MSKVKLAVIYYSSTGGNYQMAQWAVEGAREAGAEVKLLRIKENAPPQAIDSNPAWKANVVATKDVPEATIEDLEWADSFIISTPTRYGSVPSQMQQYFDMTGELWLNGKLTNKVVSTMSSAMNPHGGQEATVLAINKTMMHWGAILVPPGYTDPATFGGGGNPYGTTTSIDVEGNIKDDIKPAVIHQAKRTVTVAGWVKKGMEEL
ncbi:MAG: NAD(P)H:quinone oxidoreductase [Balneolales bacterium]